MMETCSGATKRYGATNGTTRAVMSEYFELITYTISFGVCSVNFSQCCGTTHLPRFKTPDSRKKCLDIIKKNLNDHIKIGEK